MKLLYLFSFFFKKKRSVKCTKLEDDKNGPNRGLPGVYEVANFGKLIKEKTSNSLKKGMQLIL